MALLYRSPSCLVAPAVDGYLAYDAATKRVHHLNPTAALLLELCDGGRDRDGLLATVGPLLGQGGRVACDAWVEQAERDGLLTAEPPPATEWTATALADLSDRLHEDGLVLAAFICRYRAAEIQPERPENWYELGDLAQNVGRRDLAREAYARYLAARPDDAEIEQILTALRDDRPPGRASDRCITQIYARFAESYESCMVDDLEYQAPARLGEAVGAALRGRSGLDVLELGCGTGLFAPTLRTWAGRLRGLDLSPEMIEHARRRGLYDDLEVAEITGWLAADGPDRYDLIAACDTLIYFGDLGQVLNPAAGLLRPGGLVAFTLERGETAPYALTDSGRYAHHADHVREASAAAGLEVVHLGEVLLRYEYGEPVTGLVAVLRAGGG